MKKQLFTIILALCVCSLPLMAVVSGKKWTTFDISNIKKEKLADGQFRFNSKDFPKAEIIDLR